MNPAVAYVGDYSYLLDDLASKAKKRYLVAVQSGKPVLDEELTEIGYRNLDFLRRYLERNIGDAVLDGDRTAVLESDTVPGRSWRVEQSTVTNVNNFVVKGGTAEKPAVLIVKGYPLLLFSDIEYNQQNNSGSLEDDDFTNTSIPALSPPVAGSRTDTVYVDFYLAEVSSEVGSEYQDTTIKDTNLNLQSANRWRLVQDILVATGTTSIPADGLDVNNVYHRYYKLAEIVRTAGVNTILTADISDKRTYVNTLENLSNGKGELNVFNATVQNDLNVYGTMTIINQSQTNSEKLVITCNDAGVDALSIVKTLAGKALNISKTDAGYAIDITATGTDDAIHIQKTGTGYGIHVDAGSILLDNGTDLFYSPSIEGVNSLRTHISNQLVLKEPTGFPNKTDTTFSFNNGLLQFTISPTGAEFSFYINNTKYTKVAPDSVNITDTEGMWFFYYNNTGTLVASQTPWDVSQHAPIAYVYWDATNNQALALAEERHGTVMDGKTHEYLHRTIGTRYYTGLALSGSTSGLGNNNADAQVSMTNGTIYDEDNVINIIDGVGANFFEQELSPIAYLPVFYLSGTGVWRRKVANQYPLYENVGTGRIGWNQNTGSWVLTEASNGNYIPIFVFATNDVYDPIIAILGQSEHNTFLDAQNNASYQSLVFGSLPFQEMKILFRLIFQTSNGYSNAVKARLVDIQDLRSITNVPSGSYVATDHGALSGLTDQDHPATAIFTNFSNFNGGLTVADTSVQIALDTLDDIWKRLSPSSPNTDDLYRTGDVIIGTNTASADSKLLVADNFGSNHRVRIQALGAPSSQGQYGGQIYLTADTRDAAIASVVETAIGTESWATYPRVGLQFNTVNPGGITNALRITHDGRFGFGTQTVTAGYRAQVQGDLYVTGATRIDGALTQNGATTFNSTVNYSTQTADRVALFDNSKNLVSTTVTLAELQVLDDFVENVQDIVGGMVSSNTENGLSVTYDDATGKLNFDVNDPVLAISGDATGSTTMTNLGNTTINITLTAEAVEDIVGNMVSSNTENGISVTYDDANGKLNFDVNDPVITLNGDVTGSATMTNLGNTTITVSLVQESVQDIVGAMFTGNTQNGISVSYDDPSAKINFDVNDFTITLSGDCSGSVVITNLGNATLSITVLDDSHIHDGRYYTESEADSRFMNVSGDTSEGVISFPSSNTAIANNNGSLANLQILGAGGSGAAFMMFHRPGSYAMYLGLDTDNQLKIGGWSMGANSYKVWSAANHGSGSGLDADLLDGLQLGGTTNNGVNTVMRTDSNGYANFGWINTISGANTTETLSRVYASQDAYIRYYSPSNFLTRILADGGATYKINDSWFRQQNDNANVKIYGNSRQMAFRTDGTAEYSAGVGAYPFAFLYGGDAAASRVMLIGTDGGIWTPMYGWLQTYFAAAGHHHSNSTIDDVAWGKITGLPSPVITLSGDVTGSGTMTSLGSTTITCAVADDSHGHSDSTISYLTWGKIISLPSWSIALSGDVSGTTAPMQGFSNITISTSVANNSHTHNDTSLDSINWSKVTDKPDPTITLTGAVTGSGTMTDVGSVSIATSVGSITVTQLGSHVFANSTGMRIQLDGWQNDGGKLNFGDGDYVYLYEDYDDHLKIHGSGGIALSNSSGEITASNCNMSGTFSGTHSGSFSGSVSSSSVSITGGSISNTSISGSVTSSNVNITGGSISGTSISPSGNVAIGGYSYPDPLLLSLDNSHWSCNFTSAVIRFRNSWQAASSWADIVHNSCFNELSFRFTGNSGSSYTTPMTIKDSYVQIPTLGGTINVNAIFKYSQGGIYGIYTDNVGLLLYRTVTLSGNSGTIFFINGNSYNDTYFNEISVMDGTVGQIIWIVNSAWADSTTGYNSQFYMPTYGTWLPGFSCGSEIIIRPSGVFALMKVTTTETQGLFGRANRPMGGGHRGTWAVIASTPASYNNAGDSSGATTTRFRTYSNTGAA